MVTLRLPSIAVFFAAGIAVAAPAVADDKAKSDRDEVVCKHQKRTDSRFTTKTCRTRAQWDEMAEQQKRDYAETRDRPVIETRKDS